MKVSRAAVATVAACLTVGLTGAPAASAAQKDDDSATAKSAQSAKTVNRRLNSTRRQLTTTRRQVATARRNISKITTDLGAVARRIQSAEGGVGLLLGAAPQLINGLTTLGAVVRDQIAPGLQTLAAAVQTQIAPGLQKVADFIGAPEYGVAGLTLNGGAAGVIATGGQAISSDIPEDGNPALAKGTAYIQSTGAGAIQFVLRAVIRSAEADGGLNQTAGQAGGFVTVKRVDAASPQDQTNAVTNYNQAGVLQDCADDDITTGGPANVFILGTTAGETIKTPTGDRTDLSVKNIPGGTPRTDTAGPVANSPSLFPAALPQCTIVAAAANELYEVTYQVSFLDIPTTTDPGPKD